MANIPKGLLCGSDTSLKAGTYGPNMTVHVDPQTDARSLTVGNIAVATYMPGAGYSIESKSLSPQTVPYVNAFIRDAGVIDKYWRTGTYRFRPVQGITSIETLFGWKTTGTPSVTSVRSSSTPLITVTQHPSAGGGLAPASVVVPKPATIRSKVAPTQPAPKIVVEPVVIVQRETITKIAPKRGAKIKAPDGFTVIDGRSGELVVPERTLVTFAAAVRCRFDEGLPAHVLVIGPAGTGKTESVPALAISHGMEIAGVVQCGGIEGPSDLYGQTTPDETAPHGWRRLPSALWTALDVARTNPEKKYFVLLDEVNRVGTVSAQNSLLGLLDGTEALSNPATGETIPLPPNLMVGATANIGVAYSGTVRIDAALMSRWWTNLVFGYLPETVETAIVKSITGDAVNARYLARAASELRKAHATDEFRSALIPGTREIVAVAYQSKGDPEGVAGAWHDKVTSSFSNEGRDPSRTEFARVRIIAEGVFKAPLDKPEETPEPETY